MKRAMQTSVLVSVAIMVLSLTAAVPAADWGSVKGRFVVDGPPPKLDPLVVSKDQFCIDAKPIDKSLVIGDTGGLGNAVVYIRLGRRDKIDVHPDYASSLSELVTLDNKGCEFVPHIALVRTGQQFEIKNSDPVGHNTNAKLLANGQFNVLIAEGQKNAMKFSKSEAMPMPVNCNIHPFMQAYILVQEHPYMVVSAEDGTFEIKNIPAGKREFQFWHESGYLKDLAFNGGKTDRRGRGELTIKAGETLDLGDIKVPAASLKK